MSSANLAVLILLWLVIGWRSPAVRRPPLKQAPWLAFFFLAVALTADLPSVITTIDRRSGIVDLAVLVKHLAVVASCVAVLDWVAAISDLASDADTRRGRAAGHVAGAAVAAVMIVLFVVMPRHETSEFTEKETGWVAAAYLWVFYAWLGACMAIAARTFWRTSRADPGEAARPALRAGLVLLAAGCAAAVGDAAWQAVVLAVRAVDLPSPGTVNLLLGVAQALEDASIVLILAGACVPAIATGWQSVVELYRLWKLCPLWRAMASAAPGLQVDPLVGCWFSRRFRNAHFQLLRRVIEIRDCTLTFGRAVPEETVAEARRSLARVGLSGAELDVAAEACWLRLAVAMPDPTSGPWHVFPGASTLDEEARLMCRVAAAWRGRTVRSVAAALSAMAQPASPDELTRAA